MNTAAYGNTLREDLPEYIRQRFPLGEAIDEREVETHFNQYEPARIQMELLWLMDVGELRMDGFKFFRRRI